MICPSRHVLRFFCPPALARQQGLITMDSTSDQAVELLNGAKLADGADKVRWLPARLSGRLCMPPGRAS